MTYQDEFFTPEDVDRQIDRARLLREGEGMNVEVIAFLRSFYKTYMHQEQEMLDRMWNRISNATPSQGHQQEKGKVVSMQNRQIQYGNQVLRKQRSSLLQRLGMLAAVVFLVALVGSMAIVFYSVRHTNGGSTSVGTHGQTTTAQPTAQPTIHPSKSLGKVVYSTTVSMMDGSIVTGLGWSSNAKRVGVATLSAQSWDATTGKNVVNYGPMRSGSVLAITWSPHNQLVAVTGVGQGVQIYNASTGQLLKTYPGNAQASTVSSGGGYMSMTLPLSGGSGAGTTAWSPDGKLMATAFFGSYGNVVQVWDTNTDKLVYNYTGHADAVESLSWLPDGKYVASASVDGSTQVWDAHTGKKIYDFESHQRGNDGVAWSPGGKTIAYLNGDQVKIVNPFTGKVLITHNGPNDKWGLSTLSWSPDGQSIASAGDHIELWSAATGKTYYTFTKNSQPIRMLVWSPNGKYIASADSPNNPNINATIQVWIAE